MVNIKNIENKVIYGKSSGCLWINDEDEWVSERERERERCLMSNI